MLILIAYLLLACLYSVTTPIFEASDELWHYPMVKYLADHGLALPVQDPANGGLWRQEGSQPPLYYMLGAALTFWIDTSDLDQVRHVNPHADIGIIVPDGNVNMMVHDPARESFPWHGAVLAVHLVRLLSVLLGSITVLMTYLLARELFPDQPIIALGAMALTAFNPMFLFISGSINNDNLSTALASVLLVQIVRLVKRTDAPPRRELALIGIVAGAGMLAKFNIGFLLPIIALVMAIIAWRLRDPRPLIIGGLITGGLTVLIGAWWYVRNAQLYGDPTGLNVFLRIVGSRPIPANLPQLWSERHTFLMSYWGFFGGVNVPLPDFVYSIFNGIAALSVVGVGLWLVNSSRRKGGTVNLTLGRLFTAIWIIVLFVSLLRWTSVTWASQGRLMFAAIAPLSMWMAFGLWQLERGLPFVRWRLLPSSIAFFTILAIASPLIIRPYYSPYDFPSLYNTPNYFPQPESSETHATVFCETTSSTPCLTMFEAYPFQLKVHVGEYARFAANFAYTDSDHFTRDWSVFVHFVNKDGLIVAQRDIFLGQGLWATSLMRVDANTTFVNWLNHFAVKILDNSYAPQELQVYLGFYDLRSNNNQRLIASGNHTTAGNEVWLGTVNLLPRDSALNVPNPAHVNFGDEAELVGYDLSTLSMTPGQEVKLTLYWRTQHKLTTDYRAFVHILNIPTSELYGASDSMPANWTRPTTTWQPGEIIKDEHVFKIKDDAPPGTWQIEIGMYELTKDNTIRRLRVITPDGGEAEDYLYLSRVKIGLKRDFF